MHIGPSIRGIVPAVLLGMSGAVLTAASEAPAPQRNWLSIRSKHFYVLGDAGERQLRQVTERLEQFRETLGLLLPRAVAAVSRPIHVVVFRNHRGFEPFKPLFDGRPVAHVAGFYQAGHAVDYIALTLEGGASHAIIYHEYAHILVNSVLSGLPPWFNEGLAEYYSSFEVHGRQAVLGRLHEHHVMLLRREPWLPLATLVAVDRSSPHYNERNKASVFYAQSWALVHYLLLGENRKHAGRLMPFVEQLMEGASLEEACARALDTTPQELQRALRTYIEQRFMPSMTVKFSDRIAGIERLPASPVEPAGAHTELGHLLLQMRRAEEARRHLDLALALSPDHAPAHAAMGQLFWDAQQVDEARRHLERAAAGAGADWLTHYLYAWVLRSDPAAHEAVERALRRTVELNPDYGDAYADLAWLKAGDRSADADIDAWLKQALSRAPGNERYQYVLAYVLTRRQALAEVRPLLTRLTSAADEWVRIEAEGLLEHVTRIERLRAESGRDAAAGAAAAAAIAGLGPGPSRFVPVFRTLEVGEHRIAATLEGIECGPRGIALVLLVEGQPRRGRIQRFEEVEFITYREEPPGMIGCGPRTPPEPVLVSFRPTAGEDGVIGDVVAVELTPEDYAEF